MASRTRETVLYVTKELEEIGAEQIRIAHDGSGHKIAVFHYKGQCLKFHFPSTTDTRGRTFLNLRARIRRIPRPELRHGSRL
jgi:hypothetical protein